jgi:hypothetical protein
MFLRFARWVPANGILFAVLVVIATLIKATPSPDASDTEIVSYYQDSGNRTDEAIALFLVGLGVLCFLSFLGSLRGALARSEGEPARLSTAVVASGTAFITLAFAGHVIRSATAGTVELYDERFQVDPNMARLMLALGFGFFIASFFAGAAMALAASVLALHTGVFPRWLSVLGLLAAVGGVLGFLFWPASLLLAWILAVSGFLLFSPTPTDRGPVSDAI